MTSRPEGAPKWEGVTLSAVSLGTEHGCGLSTDGRAYCWGSNRLGQLGNDDPATGRRSEPVAVTTAERFIAISAGANQTCGVTRAGTAFCWGLNMTGELGQAIVANDCGGFACSRRPVRVESSVRFDSISAGFGHTCALSGGRAFCWGRNDRGQLGTVRADELCEGIACNPLPVRVSTLEGIASISAGGDHTCAIASGDTYCWGSNQYGQLGVETRVQANPRPLLVPRAERFVSIEARGISTCARTTDGNRVCWGGVGR
ncbi:MAG TPA: hypothetical protein VM076_17790 [Gemmatimonadaceae bacterium]|nr:hypothetical protein [Gemmatimonadaceae bacterium]